MTFQVDDRVLETTATTGTGALNLAGAKTGRQTFVAGIGDGNTCPYLITDGTDWEVGIGTVSSGAPDQLSRDQVLASSNGDAAVNWGSGSKDVACVAPASMFNGPAAAVRSISSGATLTLKDNGHTLLCTATLTQNLPALSTVFAGWGVWILPDSPAVVVTLDPNSSETIDGATTIAITGPALVVSDGTEWRVLTVQPRRFGATRNTTSGNSVEWTAIPDWVNEIQIAIVGVSVDGGNDGLAIQLGDSGGYENSGYNGGVQNATGLSTAAHSSSFLLNPGAAGAGNTWHGQVTLRRYDSNSWSFTSLIQTTTGGGHHAGGSKILTGTLDRVKLLVTGTPTDAFDNGAARAVYLP